jgi:protein-L-isoaspartate(D-aspartate) O-methyltransferase
LANLEYLVDTQMIDEARINMIKQQCRTWGIVNDHILTLLKELPREFFVPQKYHHLAFADVAIPLENGQHMLLPREEAKIIEILNIQPNERVLEVGTGSGYFTALLAKLAKHVETVDIFADFIEQASKKLSAFNIHNVTLQTADAAAGYKKSLQFDVIVITGSVPFIPKTFLQQTSVNGRCFAFVGQAPVMQATLITRESKESWQTQILFETLVTPLINALQPSGFVF